MRNAPTVVMLSTTALLLGGCGAGENEAEVSPKTVPLQTVSRTVTSREVTPVAQAVQDATTQTINTKTCSITIEGTIVEAIERFSSTCGLTLHRECGEIDTGVFQCSNKKAASTREPRTFELPAPEPTAEVVTPVKEITAYEDPELLITAPEPTPQLQVREELPRTTGRPVYITPSRRGEVRTKPEVETPLRPVPQATNKPVLEELLQKPTYELCEAEGFTKADAEEMFAEVCEENGYKMVDCDPETGNWRCANSQLGDAAPISPEAMRDGSLTVAAPEKEIYNAEGTYDYGVVIWNPIKGTQASEPALAWADSYLANGQCFIDSNFENGIGSYMYDTITYGVMTVREIAELQKRHPDYRPRQIGDPAYNDVQCGHGPADTSKNEDRDGGCPGRVDRKRLGCSLVGPKWDFTGFISGTSRVKERAAQPVAPKIDAVIDSRTIGNDSIVSTGDDFVEVLEEDPNAKIWISGLTDNVAAVLEYISLAYPEVNLKRTNVISVYKEYMSDTDPYDTVVRYSNFIGVDEAEDVETMIRLNAN